MGFHTHDVITKPEKKSVLEAYMKYEIRKKEEMYGKNKAFL